MWGGRVREALYMGTLITAGHDTRIKEFYGGLLAAGKPRKGVACTRKLLLVLNAMMRDRTPWRRPHALDP